MNTISVESCVVLSHISSSNPLDGLGSVQKAEAFGPTISKSSKSITLSGSLCTISYFTSLDNYLSRIPSLWQVSWESSTLSFSNTHTPVFCQVPLYNKIAAFLRCSSICVFPRPLLSHFSLTKRLTFLFDPHCAPCVAAKILQPQFNVCLLWNDLFIIIFHLFSLINNFCYLLPTSYAISIDFGGH